MKKKMLLATLCAGVMAGALTACGAPKLEDVVEGMYDTEIESATVEYSADIEVSADVDGDDYSCSASVGFNAQVANATDLEEMQVYVGDITLDYDLGDELQDLADMFLGDVDDMLDMVSDVEAYVMMDEEKAYFINPEDGEWYYAEVSTDDLEDAGFDLDELTSAKKSVKDLLLKNAEIGKKTEEVNGETCYVLTMTLTGEALGDYMEDMFEQADMDMDDLEDALDELDTSLDDMYEAMKYDFTYYVSKDNKYLVKSLGSCTIDFADFMGDAMEDEDIEELTMSFSMEMSMTDINNTEVSLDKKAKNATDIAEMTVVVEPVEPEDPIEDPIDDPVEVDNDVNDFLNSDNSYNLTDWNDNFIKTVYCVKGFDFSYGSDYGSYVSYEDDDWNSYTVETYLDSYIVNYMEDGEIPFDPDDEDRYYDKWECEYRELGELSTGETVTFAKTSYIYKDSEYEYGYMYLFIPYEDSWGDDEYITIEMYCSDDYFSDMTDDELFDFACEVFGD